MPSLRVEIVRYTDDSQPGWVECRFRDLAGGIHTFVEKVPIVTAEHLDAESLYPRPGLVACEVLSRSRDAARIGIEQHGDDIECDIHPSFLVD